jgi:hypothetical protein
VNDFTGLSGKRFRFNRNFGTHICRSTSCPSMTIYRPARERDTPPVIRGRFGPGYVE